MASHGVVDDRTAVSASLTPRERCERYTALYIEHVSLKNQEQMINKLRSMPAFSDCADEAAVMSRITEVVNKAQEHAAVVAERDALDLAGTFAEAKSRAVERFEAAYLDALVRRCSGNLSKAARQADIARNHLRALLKKRGLYDPGDT